jgi:hypothetical protein
MLRSNIDNYIKSQKIKIIENIDIDKNDIIYNKNIKQNREIKKIS